MNATTESRKTDEINESQNLTQKTADASSSSGKNQETPSLVEGVALSLEESRGVLSRQFHCIGYGLLQSWHSCLRKGRSLANIPVADRITGAVLLSHASKCFACLNAG